MIVYRDTNLSIQPNKSCQAEGEYPNENGGMLAGRYSKDKHTVYIEKVVVPVEKLDWQDKVYAHYQGFGKMYGNN